MESLVSTLSTVWDFAIDGAGDVFTFLNGSGHELALLFAALPLVGIGVGLAKRIIRVGK